MKKDAERLRWLIKQIDAGQLAIAQVPYSDSAPLTLWENATSSAELLEHIDLAMKAAEALEDWLNPPRV